MSFMATAVIGSTVIGDALANKASRQQAGAIEKGADTSAQATLEATQMQLAEIQRQFDYQQQILYPQIQQQYAAQRAYSDLLGFGGNTNGAALFDLPSNPSSSSGAPANNASAQVMPVRQTLGSQNSRDWIYGNNAGFQLSNNAPAAPAPAPTPPPGGYAPGIAGMVQRIQAQQAAQQAAAPAAAATPTTSALPAPTYPAAGSTNFMRGPNGEFIDRNLNPASLVATQQLTGQVQNTLQADPTLQGDTLYNYVTGNRIAAPTAAEDAQVQRANDVTLSNQRGGETLTAARGGDTLEARRGNISLAGLRGNVSLSGQRGGDLLAGPSLTQDQYYQDVAGRSLAAGAAGTGVYGDTFQASPGYQFAVEEAQRAAERVGSRGGNIGGRAILEAQRRAEGLANQEYYNWAAGRTQDLMRQAAAESTDATRLDTAGANYLGRRAADVSRLDTMAQYDIGRGDTIAQYDIGRGDTLSQTDLQRLDQFMASDINRRDAFANTDVQRGDVALANYEQQRMADMGRSDTAVQNWLQRRQGDAARMDAAVAEQDRLRGVDLQRSDQAYYNYIQNLARASGFGDAASQAVSSSAATGGAVANAYANQGGQLASIYSNAGTNQANVIGQKYGNINNAVQSGIQNWVTYNMTKPPTGTGSPDLNF